MLPSSSLVKPPTSSSSRPGQTMREEALLVVAWALFLEKMVGPLGVPLRRNATRGRKEGMQAAITPWHYVSFARCC